MGGALSNYLVVGLLTSDGMLPAGTRVKIVTFGSPRVGDAAFASFWKKLAEEYRSSHGRDSFQEYSLRAYNDGRSDRISARRLNCNRSPFLLGVPMLPPMTIGYAHHTANALFLRDDRLFRIPESEKEYGSYDIPAVEDAPPPLHPKGGHNYYNGRELEKLARRADLLIKLMKDEDDLWVESYLEEIARVEKYSPT